MGFKQARIGEKSKLQVELNLLTPQLVNLTKKINIIKEQIKDIEIKERAKGLQITNHAIERFKQRFGVNKNILDVKDEIITPNLIEKYKRLGDGRIEHPDIKNCILAIQDNTIVTIISNYDPLEELNKLRIWIKYFIDSIANNDKPLTFEKYKVKVLHTKSFL